MENRTQETAPLPGRVHGYELATRTQRFFAALVGNLIIGVVLLLVLMALGYEWETGQDAPLITTEQVISNLCAAILVGLFFYPKFGGNLGHEIFGLKVISLKDGEDYRAAEKGVMRELLKYVLSYAIIPVIWLMFDEKKQNLYDKITDTVVVRKEGRIAEESRTIGRISSRS